MNYKTAQQILIEHNKWRRGQLDSQPVQSGWEIGQAIDALTARQEYGGIATELREAAINWPQFLSAQTCTIFWAFMFAGENKERMQFAEIDSEHDAQWRTYLLFVAEAITW